MEQHTVHVMKQKSSYMSHRIITELGVIYWKIQNVCFKM